MKKFLVWTAIIVGVLLALGSLGVAGIWYGTGYGGSSADTGAQYAKWKRNGLPTRKSEIHPIPVAPEDNAFEDLRQLRVAFFGAERRKKAIPKEVTADSGWKDGSTGRYLMARQDGLDKLAAILAAKKSYRSNHDWDRGVNLVLPEYQQFKDWTKLLCLDAQRRADDGDFEGAVERWRAARRLAKLIKQEEIIISNLVAIANERVIVESINKVVASHSSKIDFLTKTKQMLEETEWSIDAAATTRKEAYVLLATYRNVPGNHIGRLDREFPFGIEGREHSLAREGLPESRISRAVVTEVFRFFNEFQPRIEKNPFEPSLSRDLDRYETALEASSSWAKQDASLLLPFHSDLIAHMITPVASQRTVAAYLAILIFHETNNRWPATLAEAGITGQDGIDPATGLPLGYRVRNGEMRVWHSDFNRRDNGGITAEEASAKGGSQYRDFVLAHPYRK